MKERWIHHKKSLQTLNFAYNSVYILYAGAYWSYIICCVYMYVNNLYRCISPYFQTIIRFYETNICLYVNASVRIVTVPFVHVWNFIQTLKRCFLFIILFFFWPRLDIQFWNRNRLMWSFRELRLFLSVPVSADICVSNLLYDWLVG